MIYYSYTHGKITDRLNNIKPTRDFTYELKTRTQTILESKQSFTSKTISHLITDKNNKAYIKSKRECIKLHVWIVINAM